MPKIIIDIETIGEDYESLDETTKEVMTHWMRSESRDEQEYERELVQIKDGMGFCPLTGEIVVIGMLNPETQKGMIYFQDRGKVKEKMEENGISYIPMAEKEILEEFWKIAGSYDEFVTFNGMRFDIPFILVRSAINKVKPTKNLMANRYLSLQRIGAKHVDLLDQLTFYGSTRRRWNLHLWCRAFGIESPKAQGVTGDDVSRLFKEEKYLDIAKYNSRDLFATAKLYEYWDQYLRT